VLAVNTFGALGLTARYSGTSEEYYVFDTRGSVAERINSSGGIDTNLDTDAFGAVASSASFTDPFGYGAQNGYYTDQSTGLILTTLRYYDPGNGRFLNRDPIGAAGGINVYGYCGNNAESYYDPLGLFDISIFGFDFTNSDVSSGLGVGFSALGSSATFGIWNGGSARFDPSFGTSRTLADIGLTAASFAMPVGALSNGARSAFFSGEGAQAAAEAGKDTYRLIGDTIGGKIIIAIEKQIGKNFPRWVWPTASAIYALNAKGTVRAFLRNPRAESIWSTVEHPILKRLGRCIEER
jgi:RHS repeat-associated protein